MIADIVRYELNIVSSSSKKIFKKGDVIIEARKNSVTQIEALRLAIVSTLSIELRRREFC